MANTTNESLFTEGTEVVINNTTGLSVANGAFTAAATTNLSISNLESRPLIDIAGTFTFSAAPGAANKTMGLHFRYINIDGTSDEPAIDAEFEGHYRGQFKLDAAAGVTTHYFLLENVPAPKPSRTVEVYLKNNSGQTLTAFKLAVTPHGYVPSA